MKEFSGMLAIGLKLSTGVADAARVFASSTPQKS